MDETVRSRIKEQSETLKEELKIWERDFQVANGRKPTREEIKQNASIKQKYTEYSELRNILSGKPPKENKSNSIAPSSPKPQESRKRKAEPSNLQTPSAKRQQRTPRDPGAQYDIFANYDSPSVVRTLFINLNKKWVSPTPQKDGKYLGLFDATPDKNTITATPSGGKKAAANTLVQATPSRKIGNSNGDETPFASTHKHTGTPTSSVKFQLFSKFATPSRPRSADVPDAGRSSISRLHFSTPAFLKRDARPTGLDFKSPPVPGPRKPIQRGLSSMMKDLREESDKAQDEELDILREVENEREGRTSLSKLKSVKKAEKTSGKEDEPNVEPEPAIEVEDSQVNHLLGGFDDESKFESDPETTNRDGNERLGKDGKPLRVYKKKGQKRTTRRTKIRPTRPGKAIPHDVGKRLESESPEPEDSHDHDHGDENENEDVVLEAQDWALMNDDDDDGQEDDQEDGQMNNEIPPDIDESSGIIPFDSNLTQKQLPKLDPNDYDELAPEAEEEEDIDSGSDYTASSGGTRFRKPDQSEHLARVEMRRQAIKDGKAGKGIKGKMRKGVRKVTALAGMNFKKLKLRGKGPKGGGGGGKGRFGRRR